MSDDQPSLDPLDDLGERAAKETDKALEQQHAKVEEEEEDS